ncbi:DUF104 domain-containing protein [bacterium]|nr:DUF104 domain-containing protein [bacterium]
MTHSTTAIFENGAFKPIKPVKGIPERSIVKINYEPVPTRSKEEIQALLKAVPVARGLATSIERGRKRPWRVEEF